MKAVILVVFVLTVAAVLCLLEAYREQQYFKVTEDGVVSRRLNGLKKEKKIVFLSDLHNKEYGVGNERLLDAICKARPDLILIGGDMLVGKKGCSFAPALKFVSKLPAIAPVYYACGNHEQRMKTISAPTTWGICSFRVSSPKIFVLSKISAMSYKNRYDSTLRYPFQA